MSGTGPGTGKMRRELPAAKPNAADAAAGVFYKPPPRARGGDAQLLAPGNPEPDGPKLLLMSHGGIPDPKDVAVNSELAKLTVPQHFRIVYFFDPLATQSTTTLSCPEEVANWCVNAKNVDRWVYSGGKNPGGTTYVGRFPVVSFEADGVLGLFACPDQDEEKTLRSASDDLEAAKKKLDAQFTRSRAERVAEAMRKLVWAARGATQQQTSWKVEDDLPLSQVLSITSDEFKRNPEYPAAMKALGEKEITIYIVSCSIKERVRKVRGLIDFGTENTFGLQLRGGGVRRSRRRARTRSARTRSARTRSARGHRSRTRRSRS